MSDLENDLGVHAQDEDEDEDEYEPGGPSYDDDDSPDNAARNEDDNLPEQSNTHTSPSHSFEMKSKLLRIVRFIEETEDLELIDFFDALCWADPTLTGDSEMRGVRRKLFSNQKIKDSLERWFGQTKAGSVSPYAAGLHLRDFVVKSAEKLINNELEQSAGHFYSSGTSVDAFKTFGYQSFHNDIKKQLPITYRLVKFMMTPSRPRPNSKPQNLIPVITQTVSTAQYMRHPYRNKLQRIMAVTFKASMIPARTFDQLHRLGVVMSFSGVSKLALRLAYESLKQTKALVARNLEETVIVYDNLVVSQTIATQTLRSSSSFTCGTAILVWIPDSPSPRTEVPLNMAESARNYRRLYSGQMFDLRSVLVGTPESRKQQKTWSTYFLTAALLNSSQFKDYEHRSDPLLDRPPPTKALSPEKTFRRKEHVLRTAHIEEASQIGNASVLDEILRQLGLDSPEAHEIIGNRGFIPIGGDQLTVDRLLKLKQSRRDDYNPFDRLEWIETFPGWFHTVMAFAGSLYKQYLGVTNGESLKRDFVALKRRGLNTPSTSGPFFSNLDNALRDIVTAHLLTCWELSAGVSTAELKLKTPNELLKLSESIYDQFVSRKTVNKHQRLPEGERDELFLLNNMFLADVISYLNLTDAIRHGDVGRMMESVPNLLVRFSGGGNSNYAALMLELLQKYHMEWPNDVRDYILENAWLVNTTGKPDGYKAFDEAQEHTNRDMKSTFFVKSVNSTFEHLSQISPVILLFRSVKKTVMDELDSFGRGDRHSVPHKELDISLLKNYYTSTEYYVHTPGRKLRDTGKKEDRIVDVMCAGMDALVSGSSPTLTTWWEGHQIHVSNKADYST